MRATEVAAGIVRFTFELPLGIDHVHCYALRAASGGWTVVDTGLGVDDAPARWDAARRELDGAVERIVITHFHPDHVGAAAVLADLTGAPVFQGREDLRPVRERVGARALAGPAGRIHARARTAG